jgi:hypothetical protein
MAAEQVATAAATAIDPFWGTVISTLGGLFGQGKGKPEEELIHLPPELQMEWIQSMMDMMTPGGGGYGAQQRGLLEKQAREAIQRRTGATARDLTKNYSAAGMAGTPGLQGALQQLKIQSLGSESGAIRDIDVASLGQESQNRAAALSLLSGIYGPRRIEGMRTEEQPAFKTYRANRWKWRGDSAY